MTVLVHPHTGGEFDAPERAVGIYARAGWVRKDAATGQAASQSPPEGDAGKKAAAKTAGGSESAGDN